MRITPAASASRNSANPSLSHRSRNQSSTGTSGSPLLRKVLIASITGALPEEYREEAINLLIEAISCPDEDLRGLAVIALQEIGGATPLVMNALTEALHDPSSLVRRRSVRALGELGLAALPALPHLIVAAQDSDRTVRIEAVGAIARLGPDAEPAVPTILGILADEELRVSVVASACLKKMGSLVIPYLVGCLSDPNVLLRQRCAQLLGQIGIADDMTIEALLESCTDRDPEVRQAARVALELLHPEDSRDPMSAI